MEQHRSGWVRRFTSARAGFTLVELLVVVSIIVGLAAVVAPQVAQFATKGDEGGQAAELENVQSSMDTMIADLGLAPPSMVTANDLGSTGTAINDWSATPTEGPLVTYLREPNTKYFYCWDDAGKVTELFDSAVACTI